MFHTLTQKIMLVCLILALLAYVFVIAPDQECKYKGMARDLPHRYYPFDGCWLQHDDGSWQRADPGALPGNSYGDLP